MRTYFSLAFLLLAGCYRPLPPPTVVSIDPAFQQYVNDFVADGLLSKPKHNLLSPKRPKSSYKNNHAKRGPDGKFIARAKKAKKKLARKAK